MILPDRIPIQRNLIPYQFDIELTGEIFTIRIDYNKEYDFFTASLFRGDRVIAYNSKIVYGVPLFKGVYTNSGDFPGVDIIPLDLSGHESEVKWSTFGQSVFLFLDNGKESLV